MFRKLKIIPIFDLALILSLTSLTTYKVSAAPVLTCLPVHADQQAKTLWCWSASAEMVGHFYNTNTSLTQWDIVKEI